MVTVSDMSRSPVAMAMLAQVNPASSVSARHTRSLNLIDVMAALDSPETECRATQAVHARASVDSGASECKESRVLLIDALSSLGSFCAFDAVATSEAGAAPVGSLASVRFAIFGPVSPRFRRRNLATCPRWLVNGFVRAIFRLGQAAVGCQFGSLGFVCSVCRATGEATGRADRAEIARFNGWMRDRQDSARVEEDGDMASITPGCVWPFHAGTIATTITGTIADSPRWTAHWQRCHLEPDRPEITDDRIEKDS